jgi:hypothetical protein
MLFKAARGLALLQEGPNWGDPGSPDSSCFRGHLLGEAGSRGLALLQEDPAQVPQFELLQGGSSSGKRVLGLAPLQEGSPKRLRIRAASGGPHLGEAGSRIRPASGGLHVGEAGCTIRNAPGGPPPCSKLLQEGSR